MLCIIFAVIDDVLAVKLSIKKILMSRETATFKQKESFQRAMICIFTSFLDPVNYIVASTNFISKVHSQVFVTTAELSSIDCHSI